MTSCVAALPDHEGRAWHAGRPRGAAGGCWLQRWPEACSMPDVSVKRSAAGTAVAALAVGGATVGRQRLYAARPGRTSEAPQSAGGPAGGQALPRRLDIWHPNSQAPALCCVQLSTMPISQLRTWGQRCWTPQCARPCSAAAPRRLGTGATSLQVRALAGAGAQTLGC